MHSCCRSARVTRLRHPTAPQPPARLLSPLRRTPPEPGRYLIQSEVYPHLRSAVRVQSEQEAAAEGGSNSGRSSLGLASSARSSLGSEYPLLSSGMMAAAVDEPIRFPLLGGRQPSTAAGGGSSVFSRATQTIGSSSISRQTTTTASGSEGGPGLVLRRFGSRATGSDEQEEDEEESSLRDEPPESGLRRRPRSGAAPAAAPAAAAAPSLAMGGPISITGLGKQSAAADGVSVLSSGSGVSARLPCWQWAGRACLPACFVVLHCSACLLSARGAGC